MRDRAATYLLLAPAALVFGALFVLPLAYFLVISFWRVRLFKLQPDFTLLNYGQVFELHLPTLVFTLSLALLVAALTTMLGFIYAYLIRFKDGREVKSGDYLTERLKEIEAPKKPQPPKE